MTRANQHKAPSAATTSASSVDPLAVGVTWVLFVLALPFLESRGIGPGGLIGGAVVGGVLVILGFLAASRCRSITERRVTQHALLAVASLLIGVAVGSMNLGANAALAMTDASIQKLLHASFAEQLSWPRIASVAVVEEVAFRLFLMSVVAWGIARLTDRPRAIFLSALIISTLLFGLPHVWGEPLPVQPLVAVLYAAGVVLKSALAGLVLGWLFWRWGLPYATLCHFAANGLHTLFEPLLFG